MSLQDGQQMVREMALLLLAKSAEAYALAGDYVAMAIVQRALTELLDLQRKRQETTT